MMDIHDKTKLEHRLSELRRDIDEIDSELVQLLCERFDTAFSIGEIKRFLGIPIVNEEREKIVFDSVSCASPGEYADRVKAVFKAIVTATRAVQRRMLNLYFIGMPNCGKTKLSSRVGEILMMPSVDMDTLVMEHAGKSIDRIFDEDGESAFRALEQRVLSEVAYKGGIVAATGGGVITVESNIPILKNSGLVVFLDRKIENLLNAKAKNRPLIRKGEEAVRALYNERIDLYRSAADLTVDPDAKGAIRTIINAYRRASE